MFQSTQRRSPPGVEVAFEFDYKCLSRGGDIEINILHQHACNFNSQNSCSNTESTCHYVFLEGTSPSASQSTFEAIYFRCFRPPNDGDHPAFEMTCELDLKCHISEKTLKSTDLINTRAGLAFNYSATSTRIFHAFQEGPMNKTKNGASFTICHKYSV